MGTDETKDWEWTHTLPYNNRDNKKDAVWRGSCYCSAVEYELTRDKPLSSKYCHCSSCKSLHGASFQWAAIFHKEDLRFTSGVESLMFYNASSHEVVHRLPCKVRCKKCFTPIMDEGRRMLMMFPTLIKGITEPKAREAFKPQCHLFYDQRVVDLSGDGLTKWKGLNDDSARLDDDGNEI